MTISAERYEFEGPYVSIDDLKDRAGVYLVVREGKEEYLAIDCGESPGIKTGLHAHERAPSWSEYSDKPLFAVCYTPGLPDDGRREIERAIRTAIPFPCGGQ
jgi:hypothetical protein